MGQATADKVKEIEQARERLADDLRALEDRMPAPAMIAKRAARVAAGGGAGTAVIAFAVRRARKRRAKRKAQQHQQPVQAVIQVLPDAWAERLERLAGDQRARGWAAGAAAAWVLLRIMELRRLRGLQRALRRA